jgi:Fe-S-cluster containining protein
MNIREFSLNLQKVYAEMGETFSAYQASTGLACPPGCGKCCLNPDVEASVLEMIPLALKIYDEGKVDEWLLKLETTSQTYCLFLTQLPGSDKSFCGSYNERPSVCRMFGIAGTFDKYHSVTHSICKHLKEIYPIIPQANKETPLMPLWSSRLAALDPELIQNKLPVNQALHAALEKIAFTAQYQAL